jgi:hypothetical protein
LALQQVPVYCDSLTWGMVPTAGVLVIAPLPIQSPRGPIASKFTGAADKSAGLADADQHQILGQALARFVPALPGILPPAAT